MITLLSQSGTVLQDSLVYRPMLSQDLLEGFAVCVDLSFHVADGKHVSNFNTYSHEGMYMNRTE